MKYIKKIKIEPLEIIFNKRLKRNVVSMGADTAMHNTGIAIIRTTDKQIVLELVHKITVPNRKKIKLLDGVDLFISQLNEFKNEINKKYKLDINIIEDCFFGRNVLTLKTLARFSILVYDKFRDITTKTKLVLPNTARKGIGFQKTQKGVKGIKLKKEILNYINDLLGTEIKDYDEADAIVLALYGLIQGD